MARSGICTIFVGQAGVQIGNTFWELFCAEHAVGCDGLLNENEYEVENSLCFFQHVADKQLVPRSLMVDLEPTVIDEVRNGSYRNLFHPDMLISGFEDSGGNFARGFYTVGKLLMPKICEQLRKTLESDLTIGGVILFRSLGGGTGAGLTSAIFDTLIDLPKVTRIEVPIYPSPMISGSVVEPYNAILSEHFCMEDLELALLFDNEAMYEICSRNLDIKRPPSFTTLNRIVSYTLSCVTGSLRFQSTLNCDLNVLQTNIVPYPRIHFPISNFAPILNEQRIKHHRMSVNDMTHLVFDPTNQLVKVDTLGSKFMSCTMFYRGNVSPYEVYSALRQIKAKENIRFVDWCPTGFKVSISSPAHVNLPSDFIDHSTSAVAMLTNTASVARAWCRLNSKFQLLYVKKAFMHWFVGEGLEECEFEEAQTNIASLTRDYIEAADEDYECTFISKSCATNETALTVDKSMDGASNFTFLAADRNSKATLTKPIQYFEMGSSHSNKINEEGEKEEETVCSTNQSENLSTAVFCNSIVQHVNSSSIKQKSSKPNENSCKKTVTTSTNTTISHCKTSLESETELQSNSNNDPNQTKQKPVKSPNCNLNKHNKICSSSLTFSKTVTNPTKLLQDSILSSTCALSSKSSSSISKNIAQRSNSQISINRNNIPNNISFNSKFQIKSKRFKTSCVVYIKTPN